MSYPGGKGGEGVYHRLISMIPPHRVYIEAAIMRAVFITLWSTFSWRLTVADF